MTWLLSVVVGGVVARGLGLLWLRAFAPPRRPPARPEEAPTAEVIPFRRRP
jgi:hypothetical protein